MAKLLAEVIDLYLADRRAKGITTGTLKNNAGHLRSLLTTTGNINPKSIRHQHIDAFWLTNAHWSDGSKNNARQTLITFLDWCGSRGYVNPSLNLMTGTRKLKVQTEDRLIIPVDEFEKILAGVANPRTRMVMALGYYLMLRISEIRRLRWQDYDPAKGSMTVLRSKTKSLEVLPVVSELQRELQRWKFDYGTALGTEVQAGWLIIPGATRATYRGLGRGRGFVQVTPPSWDPHNSTGLGDVLKRALEQAGLYSPKEGGHTLRRSGGVALYERLAEAGHDRAMRTVQTMYGHAHLNTTEIYLRRNLEQKATMDLLAGKPFNEKEADVSGNVVPLRIVNNGGSSDPSNG